MKIIYFAWIREKTGVGGEDLTLPGDVTDGWAVAIRHPLSGAGILTSMVESEGLVGLPEDMERIEEGDMVNFLPFSEVST